MFARYTNRKGIDRRYTKLSQFYIDFEENSESYLMKKALCKFLKNYK